MSPAWTVSIPAWHKRAEALRGKPWARRSCTSHRRFENAIVQGSSGICQRLANIFVLQLGKLATELHAVRISCRQFHDAPDRQSEIPETRLPVHAGRIGGDSIELHVLLTPACTRF